MMQVGLAPLSSFAHFTTPLLRVLAPFGKLFEVKLYTQIAFPFVVIDQNFLNVLGRLF